MGLKDNPFRGTLQGDWFHIVIQIDGYGIIEFLNDQIQFISSGPSLIGTWQAITQRCKFCQQKTDENKEVFVVHRVRKKMDYHFVSMLSTMLDEEDFMCSKEKFPKFLEWQMQEHEKTCNANPNKPAT